MLDWTESSLRIGPSEFSSRKAHFFEVQKVASRPEFANEMTVEVVLVRRVSEHVEVANAKPLGSNRRKQRFNFFNEGIP